MAAVPLFGFGKNKSCRAVESRPCDEKGQRLIGVAVGLSVGEGALGFVILLEIAELLQVIAQGLQMEEFALERLPAQGLGRLPVALGFENPHSDPLEVMRTSDRPFGDIGGRGIGDAAPAFAARPRQGFIQPPHRQQLFRRAQNFGANRGACPAAPEKGRGRRAPWRWPAGRRYNDRRRRSQERAVPCGERGAGSSGAMAMPWRHRRRGHGCRWRGFWSGA